MRRDRQQLQAHLQRMAEQQIATKKMKEELEKTEELLRAHRTPVFPSLVRPTEITFYEYDGAHMRAVTYRLLKE